MIQTSRSLGTALIAAAFLAGCASGADTGNADNEDDVKAGTVPVISSFTATPASIAAGDTSTLKWVVKNAAKLSIDNGVGTVTGKTSIDVTPGATTTYRLTATSRRGSRRSATVTVTVTSAQPVAIGSFTAAPASITAGGSATLSWSVTGSVQSLSIDNGVGDVTGKRTISVSPSSDTTYTLTATGVGGDSQTATVTVSVAAAQVTIDSFSATPASITAGGSATLSWSATNAVSLAIDNGVGDVTGKTQASVSPSATTTYTLTATGADGASVTATAVVTVSAAAGVSIGAFSASPATVNAGGSSTLSWTTANAVSLSIDQGVGAVSGSSVTVTPSATTTYTLTATGAAGDTATATATVTVQQATGASLSVSPAALSFSAQLPAAPAAQQLTVTNTGGQSLTWSAAADNAEIVVSGGSRQLAAGASTTVTVSVTPPASAESVTRHLTFSATASSTVAPVVVPISVTFTGATGGGPRLTYVDPTAGAVRLLKDPSSTDTHLVLNLVVAQAVSGFGVALNLPLDASKVGLSSSGGFQVNTAAIDPGTAPSLAAAQLPTSGPLAGVLTAGAARKKATKTDGNVSLAAGTTLFTVALDLSSGASSGTVFDGAALGKQFRGALVGQDGRDVVSSAGFGIGQLTVGN